jgi:hypothetical protein
MTALHYLVVPEDPDLPMVIVHPGDCPQHGQIVSARSAWDNAFLCEFEEQERRVGLETVFGREGEQVPLFTSPPVVVAPGRYPVVCGDDGLRLASGDGGAAA